MLSLTAAGGQQDSIRTGATAPRSDNIHWRKKDLLLQEWAGCTGYETSQSQLPA